MEPNPFIPSFGTHPGSFYGRKAYLAKFEEALDTPGSPWRYVILTGTRGTGKTSLLARYAELARQHQWDCLETTHLDALDQLVHYVGLDRKTKKAASIGPSVTSDGFGSVSLGGVSKSTEADGSVSLLAGELRRKLGSRAFLKKGLLMTIDEVQKIKQDDLVRIGNAVQGAKNRGLPIALVVGGLPNSYNRIRRFSGCTFLMRMKRQNLWCMPKSETVECLEGLFAKVPQIELSEEAIVAIGRFTGGHPYLLQLVGSNVYEEVARRYSPRAGMTVEPDADLIDAAQQRALADYQDNVLKELFHNMRKSTRIYISRAFTLRDPATGVVKIDEVNKTYAGESSSQLDSRRAYAVNTQILRKLKNGYLVFALPHIEYGFEPVLDDGESDFDALSDDDWVMEGL